MVCAIIEVFKKLLFYKTFPILALGHQEKEKAAQKDPNKDANKRHTMSHPPDHIPDLESPTRGSRSPIKKDKKERVSSFQRNSELASTRVGQFDPRFTNLPV